MSSPAHRGPHPDDARLFGEGALAVMRRAAEEVCWLMGRGWSRESAVRAAGDHHLLEQRQRVALGRGCCSDADAQARRARALDWEVVRGRTLRIDGFNLVIAVEVALGGGALVRGRDGGLRDLAGLRGSYHTVEETDRALALVRATLEEAGAGGAAWLLDRPVSNSGRLRSRILATGGPGTQQVDLVDDPDAALIGTEDVVSCDARILDGCRSWANLHAWTIARHVPAAWIVEL